MSPFWIGVSVFALCIGLSVVAVLWKWVSKLIPTTTPAITGRTLAYLGITASVACVLLLGWFFLTEIITLLQGVTSSLTAVLQGTPLWLVAITIALFVTAFVVGPRLKLATFVAATLLLIYVTYAYRNDILEIGYTRLLLYIVAISTAILLGKALKGGTRLETWSALLTVAAVFLLLGLSHPESKYITDKLVEWWNTPSAPVQTALVPPPERRVARVPPQCPGTIETIVVGSKWVEINPGYRCAIVFDTKQGVALVGEPHNYVEDAPGIQTGNVMKSKGVRIIYARAKFEQARAKYVLCPYGTTTPGKMTCG